MPEIKYHPIIFSGLSIPAIQDGSKTQTRRVCKQMQDGHPQWDVKDGQLWLDNNPWEQVSSPYGKPGDRLWVREVLEEYREDDVLAYEVRYKADRKQTLYPWPGDWVRRKRGRSWQPTCGGGLLYSIPSIHMPRWASRITLEITDVRVQRVQEITEDEAKAEGIEYFYQIEGCDWSKVAAPTHIVGNPRAAYKILWNSINAKRGYGWETNPWVWALAFKLLELANAKEKADVDL